MVHWQWKCSTLMADVFLLLHPPRLSIWLILQGGGGPPLIHSGCCKSCSNKHTAPESWDASSCRVVGAKAYFAWDGSGLFVLILFIIIFFWWVTRLVGKSVIYWVIPYMLNDAILALYDYCWSNNSALRFTHTFMHAFFPPVAALPAERTPLSFLFFSFFLYCKI
jgi:hypothetical protein